MSSLDDPTIRSGQVLSPVNMSSIEQIKEDWSQLPFIFIKTFETPCEEPYVDVFSRTWKGTEEGCYFSLENELKSVSQI
jgi:hypothetical protein